MTDYHINVFYSQADGGYIADIPDLKYCSALGETQEEAVREVLIAKTLWLEAAQEIGKPIHVRVTVRRCTRWFPDLQK